METSALPLHHRKRYDVASCYCMHISITLQLFCSASYEEEWQHQCIRYNGNSNSNSKACFALIIYQKLILEELKTLTEKVTKIEQNQETMAKNIKQLNRGRESQTFNAKKAPYAVSY